MFTKFKVYVCMILCMISLVSVGFSSWSIHGITEEDNSGSITSDKIINSKEYVYLDTSKGDNNTGIDCFNYYEYGYLDDDGYATDTGYIKTYYILDLNKCRTLFGDDHGSVSVDIKIEYAEGVSSHLDLFKYAITGDGSRNVSVSCSCDDFTISMSSPVKETNYPYTYSITLDFEDILSNSSYNSLETIAFCVEYKLSATTGSFFYNEIFPYLYQDEINVMSFKVDLYIYGSDV